MSELTERVAERLIELYDKGSQADLDRRIRDIAADADRKDLDPAEIEGQIASWESQLEFRRPGWRSPDVALADLRALLLGQETYRAKFGNTLRRVADWFFDHYVAVASLVTVLASGFYGLAYERFYEALDITPEQAGLGVPQILIHSAVGGLAVVILAALAVFVTFLPLAPVREDLDSKSQNGTWADFGLNLIVTFMGLVVVFDVAMVVDADLLLVAAIALGAIIVLVLSNFRINRRWVVVLYPTFKPMDFKLHRYLVLAVVFALPMGLAATAFLTVTEAESLGRQAGNGEAVRDPTLLGMPFLGVRAEPALVTWGTKPMPRGDSTCLFYLGTSNDSVVLYDHRTTGTFQVPGRDVSIELRRHMSSCEAPINARAPSVRRKGKGQMGCTHGRWTSKQRPIDYLYEWTQEGFGIQGKYVAHPARLKSSDFSDGTVVRCRVTASTPLGSDVAVSRGIVVRHSDRPTEGKASGDAASSPPPSRSR